MMVHKAGLPSKSFTQRLRVFKTTPIISNFPPNKKLFWWKQRYSAIIKNFIVFFMTTQSVSMPTANLSAKF
jgi:hypothetical protein